MERAAHRPRPRAATALALAGLVPCVAVFALSSHERLLDPLTFVLAGCALAANLIDVHYEGPLWVSGVFVCYFLAAAVLGPAPAAAVVFVAEFGDALARRFRADAVAANIVGALLPTLLAALALSPLYAGSSTSPALVSLALAGVAVLAVALNAAALSLLTGIRDGGSVRENLKATQPLAPALALSVALAVFVTLAYRELGFAVSIFVIVMVLTTTYTLRLVVSSRDRSQRIAELARSRGHLVAQALDAEERERRALAERLHDHAVQSLLAARQDLEDAQEGNGESLARASAAIHETVNELREAVFELHPSVLDHAGLAAALEAVADRCSRGEACTTDVVVDPAATGVSDELLFSLARELIINAGKHARASLVTVEISRVRSEETGDSLVLEVADDGVGFDDARRELAVKAGHIGLAASTERVEALGGRLEVLTKSRKGSCVRVYLPVELGRDGNYSNSPRRIASATAAARSETSSLP